MGINRDCLGKKYEAVTWEVTAEQMTRYARASNDDNPCYLNQERPGGIVAPPLFAVVYAAPAISQLLLDQELNLDLARLVHSGQELEFLSPVRPGDAITSQCEVSVIAEKGTGELVSGDVTSLRGGEEVSRGRFTFFIRGPGSGKGSKPAEEEPAGELILTERMEVTEDQSMRYAEASGDYNPIHTDDDFAKLVGLPGIILQGLCTMAFVQKAVIDNIAEGDPTRLMSLAVRFAKPVLMKDLLETQGWLEGEEAGVARLGLHTTNQRGEKVIKDGRAIIQMPAS